MLDFFNKIFGNEYFGIALIVLLVFLVILFFVVLIFAKDDKIKEEVKDDSLETFKDDELPEKVEINDNTTSFDYTEYVKETTDEFELAPIEDIKPTPDDFVVDAPIEESIAIAKSEEENLLKTDFNFDELSKEISKELENIKIKEEKIDNFSINNENTEDIVIENSVDNEIPVVTFIDEEEKPKEEVKQNNYSSIFTNKEVIKNALNSDQANNNEPVIKEENKPLFASFNNES